MEGTIPQLYTVAEAAKLAKVSKMTIYRQIQAGNLDVVWLAPQVMRITADALEAFLRGRSNGSQRA